MKVVRTELKAECDYRQEAAHQRAFKELLASDQVFNVPDVIDELSTSRILTSEWAPGVAIDKAATLPADVRNYVARQLLRLTLRQLFEFKYMQVSNDFRIE